MTDSYRQRWLVISHAFNMDGRAASHTITDKLPHLRAAGIEVVVLSGVSGTKDKELEHYQLWPMGPAGFRFELRHVLRRRFGNGLAYRLPMLGASLLLLPWLFVEKLLRRVESSWSWWLSAYLKGRVLAKKQPFDLIYSTGGAFAAHVAGQALKQATGTPWLAEVHDPMVLPGDQIKTPQQRMQAQIERIICSQADVAIWFTDQALSSAKGRHPELGDRGKMMIPGIDPPKAELSAYQKGAKFILGHFGSLSPSRSLQPIIDALDLLVEQDATWLDTVELHVYGGPMDPISSALVGSRLSGVCVRNFGRLETDPDSGRSGRDQILQKMRSADALLLLHGRDAMCEQYIPSKLYEYLWMGRPIVAVVHRNPQLLTMVRSLGHKTVESGNGVDDDAYVAKALSEAMVQLRSRWESNELRDNCAPSPYTTKSSVDHLLKWVEELKGLKGVRSQK